MERPMTQKELKGKTWGEVMDLHFPDADEATKEYILWEETCFPFDTETTLKQLYNVKQRFNERK